MYTRAADMHISQSLSQNRLNDSQEIQEKDKKKKLSSHFAFFFLLDKSQ